MASLPSRIDNAICTAFAPTLLQRKAKKIRKQMDVEKGPVKEVRTIFEKSGQTKT